jgi:hypothetical protein
LEVRSTDKETIDSIEQILEECTTALYSQAKNSGGLRINQNMKSFTIKLSRFLKKIDI